MSILIVDDSYDSQLLLKTYLKSSGYSNLLLASSAKEAFELLFSQDENDQIDLILMDVMMPEIDGIDACRLIHENPLHKDIPIIMVTAEKGTQTLEKSLEAGALDYIRKPFDKVELLARIRSALRLKHAIDQRKQREEELIQLTLELQKLSSSDGLTGIANRRYFDDCLLREWWRALRNKTPLSLIMLDIDFFKRYNDTYGHLAGDICLKEVAQCIKKTAKRSSDLTARYGGEEFAVILPGIDSKGAAILAEKIRENIEGLFIPHSQSSISDYVTISLGVYTIVPSCDSDLTNLIERADQALYEAKRQGRNRVYAPIEAMNKLQRA